VTGQGDVGALAQVTGGVASAVSERVDRFSSGGIEGKVEVGVEFGVNLALAVGSAASRIGTAGELASAFWLGTLQRTSLYQKVGAQGEHLKFGVTRDPATRYTKAKLGGGRLKIVAQGQRSEMLKLERKLHETPPIGPEETAGFLRQETGREGFDTSAADSTLCPTRLRRSW
jgi:hypothetical protein